MKNAWTGGQYSLVRAIFGLYLFVHFGTLIPWGAEIFSDQGMLPSGDSSPLLRLFPNVLALSDAPSIVRTLLLAGLLASVFFTIGLFDRTAAVVLWYVLACLSGRNPLIANPSLPYVGWLLLLHAVLPPSPFGSWTSRRRTDPRGVWTFPRPLFMAAWIVMAAGYTFSGYRKLISPSWVDGTALSRVLVNPLARPTLVRELLLTAPALVMSLATWGALVLELLYLPLALSRRARPWIWGAMLLMHLGLLVLIDFAELSFGMVILHLFTFDPAWLPARASAEPDVVFYDGTCGLCHRLVRLLLAEDASGAAFEFAPLGGARYAATFDAALQFPDSVVVRTGDGRTLVRSEAAIHLLARLGGYWRMIAAVSSLLPRRLADAIYDLIAGVRYSIFGRAKSACPILPPDLRSRFSE